MSKEFVGRLEDTLVAELVALGQKEEQAREDVREALRIDIVLCVRDAIRLAAKSRAVVPPPDTKSKK